MKIKLNKTYYDEDDEIYQTSKLDLQPGVNVLIGCNGAGKTTALKQIRNFCKKKKYKYVDFDNYHDGGQNAISRAGFFGDCEAMMQDFIASEGERINNNIGRYAMSMGAMIREAKENETCFIILDGIDSGLSVDNIFEIKKDLFDLILSDAKKKHLDVYVVATANEFELANNERCINVVTGEAFNNLTYDKYKEIIFSTRRFKNKRYNWEEFKY